MKKESVLLCVVLMLLVSGCVTPYAHMGFPGGYREKDMGRNVWRITFAGNGYTSFETVQTFWLYRCSEVALQKGYTGFKILSDVRLTMTVSSDQLIADSSVPVLRPAQMIFIPMDTLPKPAIEADVLFLNGEIEHKPPKVFDAKILKEALEKYVKPDGKKTDGKNVKPHVHDYLYSDRLETTTS